MASKEEALNGLQDISFQSTEDIEVMLLQYNLTMEFR